MMRALSLAAALLAATALPLSADEIKSHAESWGLQNEKAAVLTGKVVDIACEISGDCAPECGGGARQLGLLTDAGKLVLVSKTGQPAFNGAVADLLPWCQKAVDLDGLFVGDGKATVFQVQFIRAKGPQDWAKADLWTRKWKEKNPQAKGAPEEWYYEDPRVKKQIDANGHLGLGTAADTAYIKAN